MDKRIEYTVNVKRSRRITVALYLLALLAIGSSLLGLASGESWSSLALNFGTEMAGAFVTFIVFDQMLRRYEKQEEMILEQERLKQDLIGQLGSIVNDVAVAAAENLGRHDWVRDGSLRGARLWRANLEGASLSDADMVGADLRDANLQRARLLGAKLRDADLSWVNLENGWLVRSDLRRANLTGTSLEKTLLEDANLEEAKLVGANLNNASLVGTNLKSVRLWFDGSEKASAAKFNEYTRLPDGTSWTPDTDMTRFTNPDHPDFWRPEPGSVWWYPADPDSSR